MKEIILYIMLPTMAASLVGTSAALLLRSWQTARKGGDHLRAFGDGWIWLGDLSGFTLDTDSVGRVVLQHRCGWNMLVRPGAMLGNLIEEEVMAHRGGLGCELRTRGQAER